MFGVVVCSATNPMVTTEHARRGLLMALGKSLTSLGFRPLYFKSPAWEEVSSDPRPGLAHLLQPCVTSVSGLSLWPWASHAPLRSPRGDAKGGHRV